MAVYVCICVRNTKFLTPLIRRSPACCVPYFISSGFAMENDSQGGKTKREIQKKWLPKNKENKRAKRKDMCQK